MRFIPNLYASSDGLVVSTLGKPLVGHGEQTLSTQMTIDESRYQDNMPQAGKSKHLWCVWRARGRAWIWEWDLTRLQPEVVGLRLGSSTDQFVA